MVKAIEQAIAARDGSAGDGKASGEKDKEHPAKD